MELCGNQIYIILYISVDQWIIFQTWKQIEWRLTVIFLLIFLLCLSLISKPIEKLQDSITVVSSPLLPSVLFYATIFAFNFQSNSCHLYASILFIHWKDLLPIYFPINIYSSFPQMIFLLQHFSNISLLYKKREIRGSIEMIEKNNIQYKGIFSWYLSEKGKAKKSMTVLCRSKAW